MHRAEMFTEFDVENGLVVNEKGRTFRQIRDDLAAMFKPEERTWDYFTCDMLTEEKVYPIENAHRVLVYLVPGGSEGYYLHVDVKVGKEIENIVLIKFLGPVEDAMVVLNRIWKEVYQ